MSSFAAGSAQSQRRRPRGQLHFGRYFEKPLVVRHADREGPPQASAAPMLAQWKRTFAQLAPCTPTTVPVALLGAGTAICQSWRMMRRFGSRSPGPGPTLIRDGETMSRVEAQPGDRDTNSPETNLSVGWDFQKSALANYFRETLRRRL